MSEVLHFKKKNIDWFIALTVTDTQFSVDQFSNKCKTVREHLHLTCNMFLFTATHMLTLHHTKQGVQFVQPESLHSMMNGARNFPAASFSFVWLCEHRGSSCMSGGLMFDTRMWGHKAAAQRNITDYMGESLKARYKNQDGQDEKL